MSETTKLITNLANLRSWEKQVSGFLKPFYDAKGQPRKNQPDVDYHEAGIMFNPTEDVMRQAKGHEGKVFISRCEPNAPSFFGFAMSYDNGAYKLFCPLLLTKKIEVERAVVKEKFPVGDMLRIAREMIKAKKGGEFSCGGFKFEVRG